SAERWRECPGAHAYRFTLLRSRRRPRDEYNRSQPSAASHQPPCCDVSRSSMQPLSVPCATLVAEGVALGGVTGERVAVGVAAGVAATVDVGNGVAVEVGSGVAEGITVAVAVALGVGVAATAKSVWPSATTAERLPAASWVRAAMKAGPSG